MKWDIVTQQRKVHVTHNQHTITWKNNLVIQKLQNYKKGTFAKWFLDKEKHYNDTYQTIKKFYIIEKN